MNVLLIDNGTTLLSELTRLIGSNDVHSVEIEDFDGQVPSEADLIILSGGSKYGIQENQDMYRYELNLILDTQTPLIGICMGFELICFANGSSLSLIDPRREGLVELIPTTSDQILDNLLNLEVYGIHRWVVNEVSDSIEIIARSEDGIELVRHRKNPIIGMQFHPEKSDGGNSGHLIFKSSVRALTSKSL